MSKFSFCIQHRSGFKIVGKNGKYNLVSPDNSLMFDKWLDNIEEHGRYIMVERQGLYNLVDSNGAFVYQDWTNDYKKVEYNGYVIIPVNNFEEAKEIERTYEFRGTYETIFRMDDFNRKTANGGYNTYVCINQEYVEHKYEGDPDDNFEYPRDEYGNSIIVVIVNNKGELKHSLCRWEPDEEQFYAGRTTREYTRDELTNLIGRKFEDVFKPFGTIEQKCKDFMEPFVNGKYLTELLTDYSRNLYLEEDDYIPVLRSVSVGEKHNFFRVRPVGRDKNNSFIRVVEFLNAKNECIPVPELISNEWFDEFESLGKDEDYINVTSGDKKYKLYRNGTLELI